MNMAEDLDELARKMHGTYISPSSSNYESDTESGQEFDYQYFNNRPSPEFLDNVLVVNCEPFQQVQGRRKVSNMGRKVRVHDVSTASKREFRLSHPANLRNCLYRDANKGSKLMNDNRTMHGSAPPQICNTSTKTDRSCRNKVQYARSCDNLKEDQREGTLKNKMPHQVVHRTDRRRHRKKLVQDFTNENVLWTHHSNKPVSCRQYPNQIEEVYQADANTGLLVNTTNLQKLAQKEVFVNYNNNNVSSQKHQQSFSQSRVDQRAQVGAGRGFQKENLYARIAQKQQVFINYEHNNLSDVEPHQPIRSSSEVNLHMALNVNQCRALVDTSGLPMTQLKMENQTQHEIENHWHALDALPSSAVTSSLVSPFSNVSDNSLQVQQSKPFKNHGKHNRKSKNLHKMLAAPNKQTSHVNNATSIPALMDITVPKPHIVQNMAPHFDDSIYCDQGKRSSRSRDVPICKKSSLSLAAARHDKKTTKNKPNQRRGNTTTKAVQTNNKSLHSIATQTDDLDCFYPNSLMYLANWKNFNC